jgi:hypothetical protein
LGCALEEIVIDFGDDSQAADYCDPQPIELSEPEPKVGQLIKPDIINVRQPIEADSVIEFALPVGPKRQPTEPMGLSVTPCPNSEGFVIIAISDMGVVQRCRTPGGELMLRNGDMVKSVDSWREHNSMCGVLTGPMQQPIPFTIQRLVQFTVILRRSREAHMLGLEVRYSEQGLLVVSVGRGEYDLMNFYNRENPFRSVFKGDVISSINGKADASEMCEEAKYADTISLLVKRPQPALTIADPDATSAGRWTSLDHRG